MMYRHEYGHTTWIDLEHPEEHEVRSIVEEYSISERLELEMLSPTPTPLVATDENVSFLVLHFPSHGSEEGDVHDQEIDIIVKQGVIVTVHYEVLEPLHRLRKVLEAERLLAPHQHFSASMLLEVIFAHLYAAIRDHTTHVANRLTHIEHDMFSGLERHTVRDISNISRAFLHIEAALANQEGPLRRFFKAVEPHMHADATFTERVERMLAEHAHVSRLVLTYRAVATELRETNAILLEARQNEIMKTLTVITFIALPLEIITFVFAMHMPGAPLEQNPNAFWIVLSLMLGTAGVVTLALARKRWLF